MQKFRTIGDVTLNPLLNVYLVFFDLAKTMNQVFTFNTQLSIMTILASKDSTDKKVTSSGTWPDDHKSNTYPTELTWHGLVRKCVN